MQSERRALGFRGIGADERREFLRQRLDALDALRLRAELLMKHDALELRQPRFELRLQIGLVEEFRVGESCGDRTLIAGDDRRAAVGRLYVGDEDEAIGERAVRMLQHEAFLIDADRGADHLLGDRQELFVERAHQRDWPFDEARDFFEESRVLDELQPLRHRQKSWRP